MTPTPALKFVASDQDGLPIKRKQVSQACHDCRRKKKRCIHVGGSNPGRGSRASLRRSVAASRSGHSSTLQQDRTRDEGLPRSPLSINGRQYERNADDSEAAANQLVELSSRFVGDLNPEGILIEATTPTLAASETSYRNPSDLGGWFRPRRPAAEEPQPRPEDMGQDRAARSQHTRSTSKSEIVTSYERARHNYLTKECLTLLPPEGDYQALKSIFLEKIHPLFPVFRDLDLNDKNPCPVSSIVMKQVIAITAAADAGASKHLRLEHGGPRLPYQEFQQRLSTVIMAVLDADMIAYRVDLIRILVMLSLFYQPATAAERSRAVLLCSQAIHYFQSLGAHLLGYRCPSEDENIERLFCAVWALDRMCAAFYARPCLFHERDFDRDLDEHIGQQPPCFRLFMRVVQSLNQVINLYRPRQPFVFIEIPVFEALIMDTEAEKLPTPLLATIEVLYHAVCVLSCRQPASAFSPDAPEKNLCHIPHPTVNPRRSLSADRIVWVVQNQEISPFPFIPYAVSLALSVQYRKMRYSRTAMYRNRGRVIFKDVVSLLKKIGDVFYSARVNASLGERILKEMEKTASSLAREETDLATNCSRMGVAAVAAPATATQPGEGVIHAITPSSLVDCATTSAMEQDTQQPPQGPDMGAFDPSALDSLGADVDLFRLFDPNFDLGAIDTALEANLDMGIPLNWTVPWNQFGI